MGSGELQPQAKGIGGEVVRFESPDPLSNVPNEDRTALADELIIDRNDIEQLGDELTTERNRNKTKTTREQGKRKPGKGGKLSKAGKNGGKRKGLEIVAGKVENRVVSLERNV